MGTKNNPGKYDCYDKAEPDEPIFVLLARDPNAAEAVGYWADLNVDLVTGARSEKVEEALQCRAAMIQWREERERHDDELYGKLKGARESLCVAQMNTRDGYERAVLSDAIRAIDRVGSRLEQWSRFDRTHEDVESALAPYAY